MRPTKHMTHTPFSLFYLPNRKASFFFLLLLVIILPAVLLVMGQRQILEQHATGTPLPSVLGLHVTGNQIVNATGQQVVLRGVNRSSFEYFCLNNWGYIAHGSVDANAVQAIANWHVNAVRIPLNEDCLLGINGVPPQFSGQNYLNGVSDFVHLLNQQNIAVILDLHWVNSGTSLANSQTPMADQDHAIAAWTLLANTFKNNTSVIFDLFNEPYPDNSQDTTAAWTCWRDGGICSGVHYPVAGMQELVTTVRNTGASNIIMLGGTAYAAHLSHWLQYKPNDPLNNLIASAHIYPGLSQCATQSCWDSEIAPVAQQVPVMFGEFGERDCAHTLIDPLMNWADSHHIGYTAWSWIQSGCASEPSLISDYTGTPTAFGIGVRDHLALVQGGSVPISINPASPTSTPSQTGTTHYLYTVAEGSISVFDIDHAFNQVGTITLPQTQGHGIRGVAASPVNHLLYVSYGGDGGSNGNGSLLAYDLVKQQVVWATSYSHGIDSMSITPDGKTIYIPDGEVSGNGKWYAINALTGAETGAVLDTGVGTGDNGPHNTIVSLNGQHVYMGDRNLAGGGSNYFYQADTTTNQLTKKIGPFQSGIRPFTITKAETLVYTSVTGFLGFQVGDLHTGNVLYTVSLQKPSGVSCSNGGATDPSHGISLSPDEKELYVLDYSCNYIHVFDVSHVPSSSPIEVAAIPVHSFDQSQPNCSYDCLGDGWLLHSSDGTYVFVGDSGDVIDTRTRTVAAHVNQLYNTRVFIEVDWQYGVPSFTTTRSGLGYGASSTIPTPSITPNPCSSSLLSTIISAFTGCPTVIPSIAPSFTPTVTPRPTVIQTPTPMPSIMPLSPTQSVPPSSNGITIYANGLLNPHFRDYSFGYASRNTCDTTMFTSSPCSYLIGYTSYGGIHFQTASGIINTTNYESLQFTLQTNNQPISNFSTFLIANNTIVASVHLTSSLITNSFPGGWMQITLPMSQLNPSHLPINALEIKNATGKNLFPIHIDDVKFIQQ